MWGILWAASCKSQQEKKTKQEKIIQQENTFLSALLADAAS